MHWKCVIYFSWLVVKSTRKKYFQNQIAALMFCKHFCPLGSQWHLNYCEKYDSIKYDDFNWILIPILIGHLIVLLDLLIWCVAHNQDVNCKQIFFFSINTLWSFDKILFCYTVFCITAKIYDVNRIILKSYFLYFCKILIA